MGSGVATIHSRRSAGSASPTPSHSVTSTARSGGAGGRGGPGRGGAHGPAAVHWPPRCGRTTPTGWVGVPQVSHDARAAASKDTAENGGVARGTAGAYAPAEVHPMDAKVNACGHIPQAGGRAQNHALVPRSFSASRVSDMSRRIHHCSL